MAVFNVKFFSESLQRNVSFVACIPIENTAGVEKGSGLKTLYLLHGLHGNETEWLQKTTVAELSEKHKIAIIMPSGENSFYLNNPKRLSNYSDLIGIELINFTRRAFPLSSNRNDTLIGGLSMGGYGAMINGLKFADTFGAILAFSSAFIIDKIKSIYPGMEHNLPYEYFVDIFGDPNNLDGSDGDYKKYAENLISSGAELPEIYIACGSEDYLIEENRMFTKYLNEIGYTHKYVESPGEHNWDFWREYIIKALDYILK